MKQIKLTQNLYALVDDADLKNLNQHTWCAVRVQKNHWYAKNQHWYMHNYIMGAKNIDHINGNGLDNRRKNLRVVTTQLNAANQIKRKTPTSSKYKGVCWIKSQRKWRASIMVNQKSNYLGQFMSESEAALAYNKAATKYFGEFARLNEVGL